jgi:hypothetical protein
MAAAAGAVIAAASAAAAAASAAAGAMGASLPETKVDLPSLDGKNGGEATASVMTIGGMHSISGTLVDYDDEWIVIRGRNTKHFLIPVQRLLALRVELAHHSDTLPRTVEA